MSLTITLDRPPRAAGSGYTAKLRRWLGAALKVTLQMAVTVLTPHKASIQRLSEMPLSLAGTGFADFAVFHVGHGWGWLAVGLSLWFIEHLISDVEAAK